VTPFAIWPAGRPFGRPFYFPPCLFNKLPGYSRARANLTASAQRTALGRAPRLRLGAPTAERSEARPNGRRFFVRKIDDGREFLFHPTFRQGTGSRSLRPSPQNPGSEKTVQSCVLAPFPMPSGPSYSHPLTHCLCPGIHPSAPAPHPVVSELQPIQQVSPGRRPFHGRPPGSLPVQWLVHSCRRLP
jgi:hypothetical protein